MTVQEAGLGGVEGGDKPDFPTSPADGKWRTKGSVDAARCPSPERRGRRGGVWRAERSACFASIAAGCWDSTLALVGCDVNLHPRFYLRDHLQGDHAWDVRGRGRSLMTCLIDLLAHHLLFPLNIRPYLSITHLIHSFTLHFFFHYSSNLLFTLICNLCI